MFGYSVAGAPGVRGSTLPARVMVGSPSGALDFDNSLLNLGTLFDFTVGNDSDRAPPTDGSSNIRVQFNGIGKNTYQVELRNTVGQLIRRRSVNVTRYGQTENLIRPVSMAPGVYFIIIYDKNMHICTLNKVVIQ